MGQVYRATDTKLKRQVAIKILPPSLAADHDRLARFQREAEVLASLNHPNIGAIYGLEDADGIKALVMELVEGEDLSQRTARGAIPLDEALPIWAYGVVPWEMLSGQRLFSGDRRRCAPSARTTCEPDRAPISFVR
jgi:hypothetical protein